MPLTPEQFIRCACQVLAGIANPYDEPADLQHKAYYAVDAAEALSKALNKSKRSVGPMDSPRRKP